MLKPISNNQDRKAAVQFSTVIIIMVNKISKRLQTEVRI